ncbi:MAG: hypothetical protein ACI4XA_05765 [Oscillospiraceae bacterium]
MQFVYVFILMFLSIFGLVMLIRLFFSALFAGSRRRFDVYVRADEDIGEFVEFARRSDHIGNIHLIAREGAEDAAAMLAEQYPDVDVVGETGR